MKNNITENINRIKQVMGLNEERVDLNTYKDESSIIEDVKLVSTTEDGNHVTSMKVNTFIPTPGSESEGDKVKIELILVWEPNDSTKFKSYRNNKRISEYRMKSVVDIKSEVELDEQLMFTLRQILSGHPTPYDLVGRIYAPYTQKYTKPGDFDKIHDNFKKDKEELENVLSGHVSQQVEPEVQNEPEITSEPEKEIKKNDMWTSTSSWASE